MIYVYKMIHQILSSRFSLLLFIIHIINILLNFKRGILLFFIDRGHIKFINTSLKWEYFYN